jgi:hypothetical protein
MHQESIYSIAFRIHLAIFLLLNLVIFLIDFLTGGGWWFYWVTLVWLIALLFQGFASLRMAPSPRHEEEEDEFSWSLERKRRWW